MTTDLASQWHGEEGGPPDLVILHGLLGSSRNWQGVGRVLGERMRVAALDLRNHGGSPWQEESGYAAMVEDVVNWLRAHAPHPVILLGHSLGGKVAMALSCQYPDLVRGLVVVDIAPVRYPPRWEREFAVMEGFDPAKLTSRRPVEEALAAVNDSWAFRKFLVSNLVRNPNGEGFRWQVNLPVLREALPELLGSSLRENDGYHGPTLVIRGEDSDHVQEAHRELFTRHFPDSRIVTIPHAGHNVHADQPTAFLEALAVATWGMKVD